MSQNILIVTPLQEEYSELYHSLAALDLKSNPEKIGRLDVHCFPEINVTLARGGHGKTQFGIQTQHLLDHAKFDLVICAGAAGALAPEVRVGDLIVATSTLEHDYNNKFSQRPKPQFVGDRRSIAQIQALVLTEANFNVHFGIMAGGDEDVIEVRRGAELYKAHNALAVAWEGIGGARASAFSEVPYLEIRGATDTANHEAPVVFYINLKIVMKNIAYLLFQWLGPQGNTKT
ncbi:MAG TPA: 5'-methylthioadenosine/S-adenosylhomocysteine nucleosidase [Anaerolineales bacterium]|nr:5'-methylthioadenosine/S-adenosylhomocysteine nucleosidase [Anaerolineales bacterium]